MSNVNKNAILNYILEFIHVCSSLSIYMTILLLFPSTYTYNSLRFSFLCIILMSIYLAMHSTHFVLMIIFIALRNATPAQPLFLADFYVNLESSLLFNGLQY